MSEVWSPSAKLLSELRAAILSVTGPYLDLSDPAKLIVSDSPKIGYEDLPSTALPAVLLYAPADTTDFPATDRFAVDTPISISIIHRPATLNRFLDLPNTRACARQIFRNLYNRQRDGSACISIHTNAPLMTDVECSESTIVCSAQATLSHWEVP